MRRALIVTVLIILCAAGVVWYLAPQKIATLRQAFDTAWLSATAGKGGDAEADAKPAANRPRGVAVVTAVATTADFPIRRYAIGFVSSPAVVDVSARISSQVVGVHVKDGQMVKAGDLLFTLDDRALKAELAKDQATLAKDQALLASAQADLTRARDLMARQTGTKQAFDQADAEAKAAAATVSADEATIDADKVQLSYATIEAPIAGRLGAIKITAGNLVSTGSNNGNSSPLVTITQMDPLEVTFSLPETDLPLLRKALASDKPAPVKLYRDGDRTPLATGQHEFVDSTVDQASGTVQVKASMPNKELTLWPGQFVDVALDAGVMPGMVSIPTVAVQPGQDGSFVYVVGPDNKVLKRNVQIALVRGANSAVSKGMKSGERVVTDGQTRLKEGTSIRDETMKKTAGAPRKVAENATGDAGGQ
jgi:multidrug efflux system membrane fusion protein